MLLTKHTSMPVFERYMLPGFLKSFFNSPQFKREVLLDGPGEVIRWWESRRFFFNAVVGCAGIVTCILLVICAFTAESVVGEAIGMPDGPLLGVFGIFFYGILANVFYTGGWIFELASRTTMTANKSSAFGLKAFRAGVAFSVLITLCPAIICWLAFAIAFLHGQKHALPGE
jgi:hypothetical protein